MSRRGRIALSAGSVVVACFVYLWFFGIQTFSVIEARRLARKQPVVMLTPAELPDLSISQAPGTKLSYFGYEFEVPWNDVDPAKTKVAEVNKPFAIVVIGFRSGNVISFWSAPSNGLIGKLAADAKVDKKALEGFFGEEAAESDYSMQRAILEATPDKVSLLVPKRRAMQQEMFLIIKANTIARGAESGIYSVRTKEFQGFQYGRPQNPPKPLRTELFGNNEHLEIRFGQEANGLTTISQSDINRIIQSIHKLPAEEAGLGPGL